MTGAIRSSSSVLSPLSPFLNPCMRFAHLADMVREVGDVASGLRRSNCIAYDRCESLLCPAMSDEQSAVHSMWAAEGHEP